MFIESMLAYLGRRWGNRRGARVFEVLRKKYVTKYLHSKKPWITIWNFDCDLKIHVDRSSFLGSCIYWHGGQEGIGPLLRSFLKPDMVFVDIGANQGAIAIPAAKRLTAGRVIAFEPVPALFAQLQHNIALNNFTNVHAVNCALSDKPGQMKLYSSMDSNNEGLASLFSSDHRDTPVAEVKVDTLDNVLSELEIHRLDVIKIDVEGAEYHVLQGAVKTLEKFRPCILSEVNPDFLRIAGTSVNELLTFLWDRGYQVEQIQGRTRIMVKHAEEITGQCDIFCAIPG